MKDVISVDTILLDLLGEPLRLDKTYIATVGDPYGLRQAQDTGRSKAVMEQKPYSMESYETVNRQRRRLNESRQALHSLLISKLPEHMTYGENIKLKGSTTQKYIKEKTGEVTGFNKAVLEMRKSIDELFGVSDV